MSEVEPITFASVEEAVAWDRYAATALNVSLMRETQPGAQTRGSQLVCDDAAAYALP